MDGYEIVEDVEQQVTPEIRRGGNTQRTADRIRATAHGTLGFFHRIDGDAAVTEIRAAFVCKAKLACRSLEKPGADGRLDALYARTCRRRQQARTAASRGEAAQVRGIDEQLHVAQAIHGSGSGRGDAATTGSSSNRI